MAGSGTDSGTDLPRQRWLRYEIARLVTWRNLLIAACIAGACCAIVIVVAFYSTGSKALFFAPPPGSGSTATPALAVAEAAEYKVIPPPPEILAKLPADTTPVITKIPSNLKGKAREEYAAQLHTEAASGLGPWSGYSDSGIRCIQENANGDLIEQCPSICVERGAQWQHSVCFSPDGKKRYHTYVFLYRCGHQALTTPDPYRDVMYAEPETVAKDYAKQLCPDCQSLQHYQDAKAQGRQQTTRQGANGEPGHG
jgi:hypothetical protein